MIFSGAQAAQTPPAYAAAIGCNTLGFVIDWTAALATNIDLSDARTVGFKAYPHNAWPSATPTNWRSFAATSSGCFSKSGGNTLCGASIPTDGNAGNFLATACADPADSTKTIGTVINGVNNFYIRNKMSWQPTASQGPPCPAAWLWSANANISAVGSWDEIDAPESQNGDSYINCGIHHWTANGSGGTSNTSGAFGHETGLDSTVLRWRGISHQTMASNGGTGVLTFDVDGGTQFNTITYSAGGMATPDFVGNANGMFSTIDSQNYILIFGWSNAGTILLNRTEVWVP